MQLINQVLSRIFVEMGRRERVDQPGRLDYSMRKWLSEEMKTSEDISHHNLSFQPSGETSTCCSNKSPISAC